MAAQLFLLAGALYGAIGVALGAFGAHGLRQRLGDSALATWETAVFYQLLHAVVLLVVGCWIRLAQSAVSGFPDVALGPLNVAGWSFALGVLLFSGSLYVLALGGPRFFGPVTPLGGAAFIVGWLALIAAAGRLAAR